MNSFRSSLVTSVFFLMVAGVSAQQATNIVISEFATRGAGSCNTACEFVELYNPTAADIAVAGWKLQYRSAAGSSYNTMVTLAAGVVIKSHGYYLITPSAWTSTPASDLVWAGSGMADNGTIRIVTASDSEVDRVAFGSGNDPKGSPAPNHGDQANNNSVERKSSAASTATLLGTGGAEEFAGNGYNSGNNAADFIFQTSGRNPQNANSPAEPKSVDGSGAVSSMLAYARGGTVHDLPLIFRPDKTQPISDIRIILPPEIGWSYTAADVSLSATMTASVSVLGDSVLLSGALFTADSAIITLGRITMPAATGSYTFTVQTRSSGGSFRPVQTQPAVVVGGAPIPISEARENDAQGIPVLLNHYVTVNGVVTAAKEFGSPAYLQDATGGIAVYDFAFADSVLIGDEVTITGKVTQFNGLTELAPVVIDARPSSGNSVAPFIVSIRDVLNDGLNGLEKYEGTLVEIHNITVNTSSWTVSGAGTNYKISDGVNELDVRVDKDVNYANQPAPGGSFDLIGVISQFRSTAPFAGGYQLMPRRASDIRATGPRIVKTPVETDITPTSVTVAWKTGVASVGYVRYGKTDAYELGVAPTAAMTTDPRVPILGLEPGTIYRVQPFSVAGADTSFAQPMFVVTASATSTGAVHAWFNKSVDNTLFPSLPALGNVPLKDKLLDRIDSAKFSIDMALYSLSGNTGDDVAAALLSAKRRGVRIRAIFEADNANTAAINALRQEVPVILDTFDPINAGAGLMHNKFFVIDAADRSSDRDDWVTMGSWNATDPGTLDDAQNAVFIQDQALAAVYTKEFEEMWGSDTDAANSTKSRFGARKLNNTPHRVVINGMWVDAWFSPSDQTTEYLRRSIAAASTSVYFCVMTYTRSDLAGSMGDLVTAGKAVRGVMDNNTDQSNQFAALKTKGVDVLLKKNLSGIMHHKYALVDADAPAGSADPLVLTGSHNWSNSAEFANNENTLGFHSATLAKLYLQEWYKRYRDAGGTAVLVLGVERVDARAEGLILGQSAPNPVSLGGSTHATISVTVTGSAGPASLVLYDALGRTVATLFDGMRDEGSYRVTLDASALLPGVYYYRLSAGNRALTRAMHVTR
ncbi:MAG: lamin tail domain-containing protein [Ignavibacteria bacterium]|nr:lamin tail domain-containing protein [Ignavibacteria bacterium]